MHRVVAALSLLGALTFALRASAEWPYRTEEASSLDWGEYSLSAGLSATDQNSRDLPGGKGVLWSLPELEGTLGIGTRGEVSFRYEILVHEDRSGDSTADSGDLRLWTKVLLLPLRNQALSLRFGTKLPNASHNSGLGTDETDFFALGLYDLTLGPCWISLNAGLGILGDPDGELPQDDVFLWAGAIRPRPRNGWSLGLDVSGQVGTGDVGNQTLCALVLDWRVGGLRFSAAGRKGFQEADSWGAVVGATYDGGWIRR